MSYIISPIEHATFLDTTTQSISSSTTAQIITYNTTLDAVGITLVTGTGSVANSRITLPTIGDYMVTFSAECNSTSGNHNLNVWMRQAAAGGTPADVANSNSIVYLTGSVSAVMTVNFIVECTAKGDILELWMSGDSTNSQLLAVAAGSSPTRPAIPSIIVTVNKISK